MDLDLMTKITLDKKQIDLCLKLKIGVLHNWVTGEVYLHRDYLEKQTPDVRKAIAALLETAKGASNE